MRLTSFLKGLGCGALFYAFFYFFIFDTLEPNEWGIAYSRTSVSIDSSRVYGGGRHYIGLFSYFIKFPTTLQSIEFSNRTSATSAPLRTRTKEGLSLNLHISFQYRLLDDELVQLFERWNVGYEQSFIRRSP